MFETQKSPKTRTSSEDYGINFKTHASPTRGTLKIVFQEVLWLIRGSLFSNMKSPSHECYMTFWPLTNSDFPTDQSFYQFHDFDTEFDLNRIMSGFHGAFATGVTYQQGTLTLLDTWFRPPFWDMLVLQLLRPDFSNLPCLYSTFHLEYPWYFLNFAFSYVEFGK